MKTNTKTVTKSKVTRKPQRKNTKRPEPFATILDLLGKHSEGEVLQAISDEEEFEAEDMDACSTCRTLAARLHLELEPLLDRMAAFENIVKAEANA